MTKTTPETKNTNIEAADHTIAGAPVALSHDMSSNCRNAGTQLPTRWQWATTIGEISSSTPCNNQVSTGLFSTLPQTTKKQTVEAIGKYTSTNTTHITTLPKAIGSVGQLTLHETTCK